jgi:hypothetical protein
MSDDIKEDENVIYAETLPVDDDEFGLPSAAAAYIDQPNEINVSFIDKDFFDIIELLAHESEENFDFGISPVAMPVTSLPYASSSLRMATNQSIWVDQSHMYISGHTNSRDVGYYKHSPSFSDNWAAIKMQTNPSWGDGLNQRVSTNPPFVYKQKIEDKTSKSSMKESQKLKRSDFFDPSVDNNEHRTASKSKSAAKTIAASKRTRVNGKFKSSANKWISATEFFGNYHSNS